MGEVIHPCTKGAGISPARSFSYPRSVRLPPFLSWFPSLRHSFFCMSHFRKTGRSSPSEKDRGTPEASDFSWIRVRQSLLREEKGFRGLCKGTQGAMPSTELAEKVGAGAAADFPGASPARAGRLGKRGGYYLGGRPLGLFSPAPGGLGGIGIPRAAASLASVSSEGWGLPRPCSMARMSEAGS